jgi:hypothetical protein
MNRGPTVAFAAAALLPKSVVSFVLAWAAAFAAVIAAGAAAAAAPVPVVVLPAQKDEPIQLPMAGVALLAAVGERSVRLEGIMLALLGTAEPEVLHEWFDELALEGRVVDPLSPKPWGASDGQIIDRYGLHWLIGYETGP